MKSKTIFGLLFLFIFVFAFAYSFAAKDQVPIGPPQCCSYYLPTCGWGEGVYVWRGGQLKCTCTPNVGENPRNCELVCPECW